MLVRLKEKHSDKVKVVINTVKLLTITEKEFIALATLIDNERKDVLGEE
jgi:hypothetical protein